MNKHANKFKTLFIPLVTMSIFLASCSPSKNSDDSLTSSHPVTAETFTITWETNIPSEKKTTTVSYGEKPEAGFTPASYEENGYTYTFKEWSPAVSAAFSDATYKALYKCEANEYTIKFVDNDETEISSKKYNYGAYPEIPDAPIKEGYTFLRYEPNVEKVTEDKTYKAIYKASQVSISINCTGCSVNGKNNFKTVANYGDELTYHFALPSGSTYIDYPTDINFTKNGVASTDYEYDPTTGDLKFTAKGNVVITTTADDYMIKMNYRYDAKNPTVTFDSIGDLYKVNWGDGSPIDTSKTHTYTASKNDEEYTIKIYGSLSNFNLSTQTKGPLSSGNTSITSVVIYRNINEISDYAFVSCSSLTSVFIPNSVSSIGTASFASCSSLQKFVLANDSRLTSIGQGAFGSCSSLLSIKIPKSVESIGNAAFGGCSSLQSVIFEEGIKIVDFPTSIFNSCIALKQIDIPKTVNMIGDTAFANCTSLTSIFIPKAITTIGGNAFSSCSSLQSLTFEEGSELKHILDNAFSSCDNISSVIIPSKVMSIGLGAFSNCSKLVFVDMTAFNEDNFPTLDRYVFVPASNSLIIRVKNIATKRICEYMICSSELSAEQIVCPSSVSLYSTKYYTLKETKELDTYDEYTNTLVKNSNISYFPTANCFDIKVGNRHLTRDTDYTYNPSTGEFKINAGVIDDEVVVYPETLNDFTWEGIKQISTEKMASQFFHIGDTRDIVVNGSTHTVRIIGFDQDVDSSGNKLGITFEFVNTLSDENGLGLAPYWNDTSSSTPSRTYTNSTLRKVLNGQGSATANWFRFFGSSHDSDTNKKFATDYSGKTVLDMLPSDLVSVLATPSKYVSIYSSSAWNKTNVVNDKIFLLSPKEMGFATTTYQETKTFTYTYYDGHTAEEDAFRTKFQVSKHNGARTAAISGTDIQGSASGSKRTFAGFCNAEADKGAIYWLRSPYTSSGGGSLAWFMLDYGKVSSVNASTNSCQIAPAFCL